MPHPLINGWASLHHHTVILKSIFDFYVTLSVCVCFTCNNSVFFFPPVQPSSAKTLLPFSSSLFPFLTVFSLFFFLLSIPTHPLCLLLSFQYSFHRYLPYRFLMLDPRPRPEFLSFPQSRIKIPEADTNCCLSFRLSAVIQTSSASHQSAHLATVTKRTFDILCLHYYRV